MKFKNLNNSIGVSNAINRNITKDTNYLQNV